MERELKQAQGYCHGEHMSHVQNRAATFAVRGWGRESRGGGARAGKMRQRLGSRDHHPKMAFAAVRTVAVIEHTFAGSLGCRGGKGTRSAEVAEVEVLAETISEMIH
jgi:hypothetical protein